MVVSPLRHTVDMSSSLTRETGPGFRMKSLTSLHHSMRSQGTDRAHFSFPYNGHHIDAVFYVDETPFKLLLYRIGVAEAPVLEVQRGYRINTYLGENYRPLRAVLGIENSRASEEWRPIDFLDHLDQKGIPAHVSPHSNECRPAHAAPRYRDQIEESSKIYFCGIIDWTKHRDTGDLDHLPSTENARKTGALLGPDVAAFCTRLHISTKWTDNPADTESIRSHREIVHRIGLSDRRVDRNLPGTPGS